ncbi:DUF192 domain-containing protein [Sulfitobacter sp. JB4-11]|uniref:DUF192 domain-containing protein n=1 Tax=Sulfitobacter rhodophyticola TaxID=3238304 RepID=UPI003D812882
MLRGIAMCCAVLPSALWAACREDVVELRGDWGQARFTVEIADDPQEQAQGLMHRQSMASSAGMLFVYPQPQPASFWMRNTLISLDMLFVDARGIVQHIHHQAKPLDETPIFGGDSILAVLEVNGGLARRMGIVPGSQMRHPAFTGPDAVWACDG